MNPSGEREKDRVEGAAGMLRRSWMTVLATTAIFAGAAALAMAIVPPVHRAKVELSGPRDLPVRWTGETSSTWLATAAADAPLGRKAETAPGVLATVVGWIEGGSWNTTQDREVDFGVQPLADGKVIVWADADDAAAALARANAVANIVATRERSIAPEAVDPRPTAALSKAADKPAAPDAGISSLRTQVSAAEERTAAAQRQYDAFVNTDQFAARGDDDTIETRLQSATSRREDLRGRIAALDTARKDARQGGDLAAGIRIGAIEGWADLQRLRRQQRDLGAAVEVLSRTLLDNHPRMAMARLRLGDIEQEVSATSARIEQELDRRGADLQRDLQRAEQDVASLTARRSELAQADREGAELRRAVELEDGVLNKLQTALEDAEAVQPILSPAPAEVAAEAVSSPPIAPALQRTVLPVETRRPAAWPIILGAAFLGFAGSAGTLLAAAPIRSKVPRPGRASAALPTRSREKRALQNSSSLPTANEVAGLEIAAVDDVIDAIVASGISRAMLTSMSADKRPIGVDVVRRVALRGQSVALVDLSEDQASARAMGATRDSAGLTDLIEGDSTFATIARRDFATKADVVPGGRHAPNSKLDTNAERRNVLDFIERSYETILVDCSGMDPVTIGELMDADAALLLAVQGCSPGEIEAAVRDLREAGLDDMILLGESRSVL